MPKVQLAQTDQRQLVITLLAHKKVQLRMLQSTLMNLVTNHAVPADQVIGPLQETNAEINRCSQEIANIQAGNPIGFPSPAQIAELQAAVIAVDHATQQSQNAVAITQAAVALIKAYP